MVTPLNSVQGIQPVIHRNDPHPGQPHDEGQVLNASSIMSLIAEETRAGALYETVEEMSLLLGTRRQDEKQAKTTRQERSMQALLALIQKMLESSGDQNLLAKFSFAGQDSELNRAQKMLQISSLLLQYHDNPARRRTLSQQLAALMEEAGWEVELFGLLEFGQLNPAALRQMKRLFQQSIDDEEEQSLDEWFKRVSRWQDRKRKIRVLLRALAFDMSTQPPTSRRSHRLAAVLRQLRRVLLFLGLEDHCNQVGCACGLQGEVVLQEVLTIVGQSWLFSEWLQQRFSQLEQLTPQRQPGFVLRLCELFKLMPATCFKDDDQREQILETLVNFESS